MDLNVEYLFFPKCVTGEGRDSRQGAYYILKSKVYRGFLFFCFSFHFLKIKNITINLISEIKEGESGQKEGKGGATKARQEADVFSPNYRNFLLFSFLFSLLQS